MEKLSSIKNKIKKALKNQGVYSPNLDICIGMAAGSYLAFLHALSDIEDLKTTVVIEKSREGHERKVAHPAYKVLKDTQEMVRKSLRELGLTLNTLSADEDDLISDLEDEVNSVEND